MHAFKYGDRLDLAPTMGRWMARAGRELLAEADAVMPVPLHWRRLWARRFNQSALLAKAIADAAGVPVADERAASASSDAAAGRAVQSRARRQRAGCLPGAADGKAEIAGRSLLLVDDVLTSGATVDTCARRSCGPALPGGRARLCPGCRASRLPYSGTRRIKKMNSAEHASG